MHVYYHDKIDNDIVQPLQHITHIIGRAKIEACTISASKLPDIVQLIL